MFGITTPSKPKLKAALPAFLFALGLSVGFSSMAPTSGPTAEPASVASLFLGPEIEVPNISTKDFPTEPVEALAREMAHKLQPGIRTPIEVRVGFRSELTPLTLVSKAAGGCTIVLNSNPKGWGTWKYFFSEAQKSEWMSLAELSIAHEIGHCADLQTSVAAGVDLKKKSVLSGELFADVYATLYAREWMGPRAANALRVFVQVREDLAREQPGHATARQLRDLQSKLLKTSVRQAMNPEELSRLTYELTHL